MKLYFSGIASPQEANMLKSAGCEDFLADLKDVPNLPIGEKASYALDSGAYRAWKSGKELTIKDWESQLFNLTDGAPLWPYQIDFVTMPDVLGDPVATWDRWQELRAMQLDESSTLCQVAREAIPVWQWGASFDHLQEMVNFSPLVAIGGCVPWMREKDATNLEELVEICDAFAVDRGDAPDDEINPAPFHVLGLNWLEAIVRLAPLVRSCDTSKWLDGARYGVVIHDNGDGLVAERKEHCRRKPTRYNLCVESAETMHRFVNLGEREEPRKQYKKVRDYTLKTGDDAPVYTGPGKVSELMVAHSLAENEKRAEDNKENYALEMAWRRSR
jgi:hypothetical protein